jgi:hypothetical protein
MSSTDIGLDDTYTDITNSSSTTQYWYYLGSRITSDCPSN